MSMSGKFQADPARQSESLSRMEEVGARTEQARGRFLDSYAALSDWAGHGDSFAIQAGGQSRQFVHTIESALTALRSASLGVPGALRQSGRFVQQVQQGVGERIGEASAAQGTPDTHNGSGKY